MKITVRQKLTKFASSVVPLMRIWIWILGYGYVMVAMKISMRQKLTFGEELGDDNLGHSLPPLMFPRYGYMDCGYGYVF